MWTYKTDESSGRIRQKWTQEQCKHMSYVSNEKENKIQCIKCLATQKFTVTPNISSLPTSHIPHPKALSVTSLPWNPNSLKLELLGSYCYETP